MIMFDDKIRAVYPHTQEINQKGGLRMKGSVPECSGE